MQGVQTAIADLFMDARDVTLYLQPPTAAFLAAGQTLLVEGQAPLPLGAMFGISDFLARRQGG